MDSTGLLDKGASGVSALGLALGHANKTLRAAEWAWSHVRGPFTACAASAARLKWRYLGGLRFLTDVGEPIDLAGDSPQYVKLRVRLSARR